MSTSRAQAVQPTPQAHKPDAIPHEKPVPRTPPGGLIRYKQWDQQHEIFKRMLGGLYSPREPIEAALAIKDGHTPVILDVGTGSGIWAIDMANKFPHCEVIGIDTLTPAAIPLQSNLRFEVADVNLPLPMETASVDFVFARGMHNIILDYPKWLSEVSRILRPGGIYQNFSVTTRVIQEDGTELPNVPIGEEGYTGYQSMLVAWRKIPMAAWGGKIHYECWTSWMEENGNFDKIERSPNLYVPLGAWQTGIDENTRIAAELMRDNILTLMENYKSMVTEVHGEEPVQRWIEDATQEIAELRFHLLTEWASAWCRRSTDEWKPVESKSVA